MSTIKKLDETSQALLPSTELTATEMLELYVDNETGHRDLVYGDRPIKGAAPAHDHGQDGGRVQPFPLVSVTFASTSVTYPTPAIPGILLAALQDAADETIPVRLCSIPVFAVGGVSECKVSISVIVATEFLDAECQYAARLGYFDHALYNYDEHPGIDIALSNTESTPVSLLTSAAIDLTDLGDATKDRELELVIYQVSNTSNDLNFLSGVIVYASGFTRARRPTQRDLAYRPVQPSDVVGAVLNPDLTRLIRDQENARCISLLGRAPGLTPSLTPDKRTPFLSQIYYPHQHQGVLCPDGYGGFTSDGRVLRRQYASVYCTSAGEDASGSLDGDPGRGFLIHPNGTLASDWGTFYRRVPISCGTPFLDIRFALSPATTDIYTRLTAQVTIYRATSFAALGEAYTDAELLADQSVFPVRYLTSGRQQRSAIRDDFNHTIQVEPLDHTAWYRDAELKPEQGRWSLYTLRGASEVPTGINRTYPYRISNTVTAHLSQPALRPRDGAHPTMDWTVVLRLNLETLDSGGYDSGARLLWWTAIPRDME